MTMRDLFGDDQQLVAGSLRGYRCWSSVTKDGELRSVGVSHTWKAEPYVKPELAVCRGGQCGGPSPGEKCTCGIYGWYDPEDRRLAVSSIFGVIAASGRVQLGTHGFRAERAQVLAVATIYGYLREILIEKGFKVFETPEELIEAFPKHDVSGFVKHRCKDAGCADSTLTRSSIGLRFRAMAAAVPNATTSALVAAARASAEAARKAAQATIDEAKAGKPEPKPKP